MKHHHLLLVGMAVISQTANGQLPPATAVQNAWPNFDQRAQATTTSATDPRQVAALAQLQAQVAGVQVDFDEITGTPRYIRSTTEYLTPVELDPTHWPPLPPKMPPGYVLPPVPDYSDPYRALRQFLQGNNGLFGHGSNALDSATITREFSRAQSGLRTVVWQQQLQGIPIFEAILIANFNGYRLLSVSSGFLPDPPSVQTTSAVSVSPQQALVAAAQNIGQSEAVPQEFVAVSGAEGAEHTQKVAGDSIMGEAQASLVWLPMDRYSLRLCWRLELTGKQNQMLFQSVVDAGTGQVLIRHCWTSWAVPADYFIFASGTPTPPISGLSSATNIQYTTVAQTNIILTAFDTNASPAGWVNTNAGLFVITNTTLTNATFGNNVDAILYWTPQSQVPPYGSVANPARLTGAVSNGVVQFTGPAFTADFTQWPTNFGNNGAAVVSMFYWCNWMHDVLYELGFTEAAGNYQYDNFGRGGVSGDPVLLQVQDNAVNGINFAGSSSPTPHDGTAGSITIGLFGDNANPRDGALDATIHLHEYTHLMSKRLVGGGVGITADQTAALGEGWSDFYALALLSDPTTNLDSTYVVGGFSTYHWQHYPNFEENYYFGVRPYPCSTDMSKSPQTLRDLLTTNRTDPHAPIPLSPIYATNGLFPLGSDIHARGEIWTAALWDARVNLIRKYGPTSGNWLTLELVTDAMSLCPPNPNYLQARDSVLAADFVRSGGNNQLELWAAFAKRGMGIAATNAPSDVIIYGTSSGVQESFSVPALVSLGNAITSSPACNGNGNVYVGAGPYLYGLGSDGSQLWAFGGLTTNYAFNSSPALSASGTIYVGCNDSNLYAIASSSGSMLWSTNLGGGIFSSPAVGLDGTIYIGASNGLFYAINADGSVKWSISVGADVVSSPALGLDGTIYFGILGATQNLYAVSPTSGASVSGWPVTVAGGVLSSPGIGADGNIYVGGLDGKIYAFTPAGTSKSGWPSASIGALWSSPAIGPDGVVYVGSSNGVLYALNTDASIRWTNQTGAAVSSSPAVGRDSTIFVGSGDSKLYVISSNGVTRWTYPVNGPIISSPLIGFLGRVYFASTAGDLYYLPVGTTFAEGPWPMFHHDAFRAASVNLIYLRQPHAYTNGVYTFEVTGPPGVFCEVQFATNLSYLHWFWFTNVTLTGGAATVQTVWTNSPQYFYRAILNYH